LSTEAQYAIGKVSGKDTMKTYAAGPVKTSNTDQQDDNNQITLPNGCDQDFVFYED